MKMNFSRKAGILLACATLIATTFCTAQNVQRTGQGVKYSTQGMDISVDFYSPSIVRVYKTPEGKTYNKESLVVTKSPETTTIEVSQEGGLYAVKSSQLKVLVNPATGGISFYTPAGKELLKEKASGTDRKSVV